MLQLEPTTLFYHDLTFRLTQKSSQAASGLIDNWVAGIPKVAPPDGTRRSVSQVWVPLYSESSTLVTRKGKGGKDPVGVRKSRQPTKLKPVSEPLELLTASDTEWLESGGKPAVQVKKEIQASVSLLLALNTVASHITGSS